MIASLTNLPSIKRVAAVMVSSVIALCTASGHQREQKPPTMADLRNAMEAVLHETRTPGASIAIVSRDKIEWAAGLGVADVARKTPPTAETLFRIGSISKSFAALAALKLEEEGKLKLTDTVRQWLPEVAFENVCSLSWEKGGHESGGLLAFPRRYRRASRCGDLLWILGTDWRASMGVMEFNRET